MFNAMRSPGFSPSVSSATAHFATSSSRRLRLTVKQSSGAPFPPSADMSQRSPSNTSAASSPWPESTWRSSSEKAALVRPPTNQRQCGATEPSKPVRHGVKSAGRSGLTGSAVAASQPCQRPSAPRASHAPEAPQSATNQCMPRPAISPWNAPGSASAAARMASQSAWERTRLTCTTLPPAPAPDSGIIASPR